MDAGTVHGSASARQARTALMLVVAIAVLAAVWFAVPLVRDTILSGSWDGHAQEQAVFPHEAPGQSGGAVVDEFAAVLTQ